MHETPPFRPITSTELDRMRQTYEELAARWIETPPGKTLELEWPVPAVETR